jgi:HEAT repeat protein
MENKLIRSLGRPPKKILKKKLTAFLPNPSDIFFFLRRSSYYSILIRRGGLSGLVGLTFLLFMGCTAEKTAENEILLPLQVAILHENYFVRSAGIKAIGEMGNPARLPLILPGFKDPVSFVRLFSVESAAQLPGPDRLKLLLAAGDDPDPMVRVAVVKALDDLLGTTGTIDSVPANKLLTPFTKDPDDTVHLFAYAALARQGDEKALIALQELAQSHDVAMPAMVALGRTKRKEAIPILSQALKNPDETVRMFAAEALGEVASKKTFTDLAALATDQAAIVRGAVATSLGKIGDPKAIPILDQLLNDPEPIVQLSAAEGLMRLGKKRLDVYEKNLHHADYGIRHFAIGSLQKTAGKEALPLLTRSLSDEAPRVRIAAVRAIGSIGDTDSAGL